MNLNDILALLILSPQLFFVVPNYKQISVTDPTKCMGLLEHNSYVMVSPVYIECLIETKTFMNYICHV